MAGHFQRSLEEVGRRRLAARPCDADEQQVGGRVPVHPRRDVAEARPWIGHRQHRQAGRGGAAAAGGVGEHRDRTGGRGVTAELGAMMAAAWQRHVEVTGHDTARVVGNAGEQKITGRSRPAAAGRRRLAAVIVAPSNAASSPRGRGRTWRGRMGTGTRRGYRGSRSCEPDVRSLAPSRRDLHRLERKLHDLIEHGSRDRVAVVVGAARVLDDHGDNQLRVTRWRDADVARVVPAQAPARRIGPLGGARSWPRPRTRG